MPRQYLIKKNLPSLDLDVIRKEREEKEGEEKEGDEEKRDGDEPPRKKAKLLMIEKKNMQKNINKNKHEKEVKEQEHKILEEEMLNRVIRVFDHITISISADDKEFRNKTVLTFQELAHETANRCKMDQRLMQKMRKTDILRQTKYRKEIFPERIAREAN